MPYDISDSIDLFIISVRSAQHLDVQHFGQFVFPKTILYEKGILSQDGKGGKRAMRIYPSWDIADNKQAKNTQAWQLLYFFEIYSNKSNDITIIQKLFL